MGNKNEETKEMLPEDKMIQALTENSEANLTAANIPSEEPLPDDFAEAGENSDGAEIEEEIKKKEKELQDAINKKEQELQNLLLKRTQYYNSKGLRGYISVPEEDFRKMMKPDHVVTSGNKAETEQSKLKKDLDFLTSSMSSGTILTGKIVGMHNTGEGEQTTPCATVSFRSDNFKIIIPFYCLFADLPMRERLTPESRQESELRITRMFGSQIDFVVRHIDMKTKTVIADRLQAMAINFMRYWTPGRNGSKPECYPGLLVEATVIARSTHTITLHALGVDQTLALRRGDVQNEISWTYISDLSKEFKIGQKVNCKILSVATKEKTVGANKYILGDVKLSIRQATKNPQDKFYDEINEGDIYQATVTASNTTSYFVLLMDKVECMVAKPRNGERLPEIGDSGTVVRVTEKVVHEVPNPETGETVTKKHIYGVFISY